MSVRGSGAQGSTASVFHGDGSAAKTYGRREHSDFTPGVSVLGAGGDVYFASFFTSNLSPGAYRGDGAAAGLETDGAFAGDCD